jgi:hypothetical protein
MTKNDRQSHPMGPGISLGRPKRRADISSETPPGAFGCGYVVNSAAFPTAPPAARLPTYLAEGDRDNLNCAILG